MGVKNFSILNFGKHTQGWSQNGSTHSLANALFIDLFLWELRSLTGIFIFPKSLAYNFSKRSPTDLQELKRSSRSTKQFKDKGYSMFLTKHFDSSFKTYLKFLLLQHHLAQMFSCDVWESLDMKGLTGIYTSYHLTLRDAPSTWYWQLLWLISVLSLNEWMKTLVKWHNVVLNQIWSFNTLENVKTSHTSKILGVVQYYI